MHSYCANLLTSLHKSTLGNTNCISWPRCHNFFFEILWISSDWLVIQCITVARCRNTRIHPHKTFIFKLSSKFREFQDSSQLPASFYICPCYSYVFIYNSTPHLTSVTRCFLYSAHSYETVFYHGPCRYDRTWSTGGNSPPFPSPSSIGPIRAKQIHRCSSVIGWQYWGQPGATLAPVSCTLQCKQLNKCTAKHWAEQSVCTSLHKNAVTHSVLLGSKYVRKRGAPNFKF